MADLSAQLAASIEHTQLAASTTVRDVAQLCSEAVQHGFFGVCVNPLFVATAREALRNSASRVVTVVGFPLGATLPTALAHETREVLAAGAHEIDMVIPIGLALAGDFERVTQHVQAVREASPGAVLKVILETGYFNAQQIEHCARAALRANPQFLKTSTGFGPRGASVEDVKQLKALCPVGVGVKASGGIRLRSFALELLDAGATRLGTSSSIVLMSERSEV
jgi:deoxyribose-phosphate aldolase